MHTCISNTVLEHITPAGCSWIQAVSKHRDNEYTVGMHTPRNNTPTHATPRTCVTTNITHTQCIHTHTHTHIYIHCTHTAHTHMHTPHTCTHTKTHTHTHTHAQTHTHACIWCSHSLYCCCEKIPISCMTSACIGVTVNYTYMYR